MPTQRLTERAVSAARTSQVQEDLRDSVVPGLILRIYRTGRKTWGVVYRADHRRRRWFKLGLYPSVGLAQARRLAREVLGRVAAGHDPQAERERLRSGREPTVEELAAEYLDRYARRRKRPRSHNEDAGQIQRYVLPAWRNRKAVDIARRDVKRLLEDLADGRLARRGQPTTTAPRALRALLSKMFAWAVEEEILPANPAAGVPLPVHPTPRDRVLTEDELRELWRQLDIREPESPVSSALLRLLLLTAQRPGEVLTLRWADISGPWWTIPAGRSKNRRSHRVPLSPQALAILENLRPVTGASPWVLESPVKPGSHLTTVKTLCNTIHRHTGMKRWTLHDLRRTAATHMTSSGVPRLVVERILNHSEHGVAAVYDRSSYDREKRRALLAWARRLEQIVKAAPRSKLLEFSHAADQGLA